MNLLKSLRKYCFSTVPKYQPKIPIKHQYIKLPARPKMDPDDPTETYDIAKMPNAYNALRTDFKYMHSIGSMCLSIPKDGKVYHLFDASRMPFGKMCLRIAQFIQGRHKPTYKCNEIGSGDQCVVINASNMYFTGKKIYQKKLKYHTGYIGHLRQIQYSKLIKEKPEQLISYGVWKLLPKNKLRMRYLENLKIYRTREHDMVNILPQILPRKQHFVYNGSIQEDITKEGGKIIFSMNEITQERAKKEYNLDVDLDAFNPDEEIFKPFSQRDYKIRSLETVNQRNKLISDYKRIMKRYRRYYAQSPKIKDRKYNPRKTYMVTTTKRLKELGLQNREPLDDDPEIEEEIVK